MTHTSPQKAEEGARRAPSIPANHRKCRNCETTWDIFRERSDKEFCSNQCRAVWWRRAQVRGGQVYELLMKWRENRGKKFRYKGRMVSGMSEIAHEVDRWQREDREAGR